VNPLGAKQLPQATNLGQPDLDYRTNLKKVTKGSGIGGFGELGYTVLAYMTNIVIARFLGAEGIGIYTQATTITSLVTQLARLGFDAGILKFISQYLARKDFKRLAGLDTFALKLVTVASLLLSIILFIEAELIAEVWLDEPQLVFILRMFALTIPFLSLTSIWLSGLQAFQRIDYQVYLGRIFRPFITLSLISLFLFLGWQWSGLVWGVVIGAILLGSLTGYVYSSLKKKYLSVELQEPHLEVREWLKFCLPLFLSGLLAFTITRVTTLILGSFQSSAEVGVYDVTLKISLFIQLPLTISNTVFAPIIGEAYNTGNLEKLGDLLKTVTKWVFTLGFFAFLAAILFAEPLLSIFGREFVAGMPYLLILGLGQMTNIGTGAVAWVLIMAGYSMVHLFNAILSALLLVLLNYWLIPKYGTMGAAMAVGLTMTVVNILRIGEVFYFLKIHPYRWDFIKPLVAGLTVFAIITQLQPRVAYWINLEILATLLLGVMSIGLFVTILILLQFREEEKELISLFFQKLKLGRKY
jgi:O-antigen/teichoic acid export membrane protein